MNEFINNSASESLIESNKRIANMLKDQKNLTTQVDQNILIEPAELALLKSTETVGAQLSTSGNYNDSIDALVSLKSDIDAFFEQVMVNADDPQLKQARLSLLNNIRHLFLSVADISHLSA